MTNNIISISSNGRRQNRRVSNNERSFVVEFLKRNNMYDEYRRSLRGWNQVRILYENLLHWVGTDVPDCATGNPLVIESLRQAINHKKVFEKTNQNFGSLHISNLHFIKGLLESMPSLFDWKITAVIGTQAQQWDPFRLPYNEWKKFVDMGSVSIRTFDQDESSKIDDKIIRSYFYFQLVSKPVLLVYSFDEFRELIDDI